MKEIIAFLNNFRSEVSDWLERPSVTAPAEPMIKILTSIDLSIDIITRNRKVTSEEKDFFAGGYYLLRYFDGWGVNYYNSYSKMVKYLQENNHF